MKNSLLWFRGAAIYLAFSATLGCRTALADDLPLWQKFADKAQQAFDQGKYSTATRMWLKVVDIVKNAGVEEMQQLALLANDFKHLGDCYRLTERWQQSGDCYRSSLDSYNKMGADKPEVKTALKDISTDYRNIEIDRLGEKTAKRLKDVGAVSVASFKTDKGDHFEVCLQDPYIQEVNDGRVEKVRFNKRICFDFFQTPEGKLNVSKIKGIEIKADFWVQPKSSCLFLDQNGDAVADVTVSAAGIEKKVTVNPPRKVYDHIVALVKASSQTEDGKSEAVNASDAISTDNTVNQESQETVPEKETAPPDHGASGEAIIQSTTQENSLKEDDSVGK